MESGSTGENNDEFDRGKRTMNQERGYVGPPAYERKPDNHAAQKSSLKVPLQFGDETARSFEQPVGFTTTQAANALLHNHYITAAAEGNVASSGAVAQVFASSRAALPFAPGTVTGAATFPGQRQRAEEALELLSRNPKHPSGTDVATNVTTVNTQFEELVQPWRNDQHQRHHGAFLSLAAATAGSPTLEAIHMGAAAIPIAKSDIGNQAARSFVVDRNYSRGVDGRNMEFSMIPTGEELIADESIFDFGGAHLHDAFRSSLQPSTYLDFNCITTDFERKTAVQPRIDHHTEHGREPYLIGQHDHAISAAINAFAGTQRNISHVHTLPGTHMGVSNTTEATSTGREQPKGTNVAFYSSSSKTIAAPQEQASSAAAVDPNLRPQARNVSASVSQLTFCAEMQASYGRLKEFMAKSRVSQKALQDWDVQQGLPRSHSWTMMHTSRSRRQLEENRILSKWNGDPLINDSGITFISKKKKKTKKVSKSKDDSAWF